MDTNVLQGVAEFQHPALPDDAACIRLLRVLDDNYSEDIKVRCSMTTWHINNIPSYRALSYTWGDPNSCSAILVNDQVFQVRKNCEFVLKQAYWYQKTSYYWVDAICIDQESLTEKSMQVSRMGNIFKQAAQVLACVGDHADDSAFLFQKLNERPFLKRLTSKSGLRGLRFKLRNRCATTVRTLDAALNFLWRPYFTRLWILQELRNAQEAVFLCGSHAVPQRVIRDVAYEAVFQVKPVPPVGRSASISTRIFERLLVIGRFLAMQTHCPEYRNECELAKRIEGQEKAGMALTFMGNADDIFWLLHMAEALECQERKDKIFGLISLIDWAVEAPLIPDYTQTELEVAVSFFKALLFRWQQGGDFSLTGLPYLSSMVTGMLHLNTHAIGVPNEFESRQVAPGSHRERGNINTKYTHTRHESTTGWRVTGEYLTKNDDGFLSWSPSGSQTWKIHLPTWAKDGDWIVQTNDRRFFIDGIFVLVREVKEGSGGPLVGRAGSERCDNKNLIGADFGINWDPEDLVMYSIVNQEMPRAEFNGGSGQYSAEWVRALNTAVCRKDAPGSSYAFRCDTALCSHHI